MTATNDDILTALNKLIELQKPKENILSEPSISVSHDGIEVSLNKEDGLYYPKEKNE